MTKRQYQSLDLSTSDWMLLEELVKALHPLEIATAFISSENMCSLPSVLPVIHGTVGQLEPTEDDSELFVSLKELLFLP